MPGSREPSATCLSDWLTVLCLSFHCRTQTLLAVASCKQNFNGGTKIIPTNGGKWGCTVQDTGMVCRLQPMGCRLQPIYATTCSIDSRENIGSNAFVQN